MPKSRLYFFSKNNIGENILVLPKTTPISNYNEATGSRTKKENILQLNFSYNRPQPDFTHCCAEDRS